MLFEAFNGSTGAAGVGARVSVLEEAGKKQLETNSQLDEANKQQTRTMLDLQSQIESMSTELRSLRGQNEELLHKLQDTDKRQKDFYIDLDTRLRRFEQTDTAPSAAGGGNAPATSDPAGDFAFGTAHGLFKMGKHQDAIAAYQDFLKKFPDSANVPGAHFEMGAAYFLLNDFQHALSSYQVLAGKFGSSPKAPEAMLGISDCQQELKDPAAARKTLKQLIAKYPGSEAASEAKRRLTIPNK